MATLLTSDVEDISTLGANISVVGGEKLYFGSIRILGKQINLSDTPTWNPSDTLSTNIEANFRTKRLHTTHILSPNLLITCFVESLPHPSPSVMYVYHLYCHMASNMLLTGFYTSFRPPK